MSYRRPCLRPHGSRAVHVRYDHDPEFRLWVPRAEDVIIISGFGDAVGLGFELIDTPAEREVLVLINDDSEVTAMLFDPPADVGVFIGMYDGPGSEIPFTTTLSYSMCAVVHDAPPADDDCRGYFALRRAHMAQGVRLLDVMLTSPDRVQSLAMACDPDPVWNDTERWAA